jgi:hypothetical protein
MGEAKQKRSATQKLIEQYPFCYFCGGTRAATTREHMPPRSLFENSYRPDKLVMPACADCNKGTSTADLAVAIVSRWDYHSYSPDHAKLVARAGVQAPEMAHEWTKMDQEGGREKARRHLRNQGVEVPDDAGLASIGPLTVRQLTCSHTRRCSRCILSTFANLFMTTGVCVHSGARRRILREMGSPR